MKNNANRIFVLSTANPCESTSIAASEDRKKLHGKMKEVIRDFLTDLFGDRNCEENIGDEYVQGMFESVDRISARRNSWTYKDDEFPVTFAINEVEII